METDRRRLIELSRELATFLTDFAKVLEGEPAQGAVAIPPEIEQQMRERFEARKCLVCQKPVGDSTRRGLCTEDYAAYAYRKKRGEITEAQAISQGMLAPLTWTATRPTRRSSALDAALAAKQTGRPLIAALDAELDARGQKDRSGRKKKGKDQ